MEYDIYEAAEGKLYKGPDDQLSKVVITKKGSDTIERYELVDV